MPLDRLFFGVLTDLAGPATDPIRISRAWLLFLILAILLTLFVLGVALMTIAHRLRNRREESIAADEEVLADPWQEAGKRATPLDGGGTSMPDNGEGDDED